MTEIKYTATMKIITGGTVTEISPRSAFISSSGTAHYENCSVVTRMLSGNGGTRMASRNIITAEKALTGLKNGSYESCAACAKIHNNRSAEYAENAELIPSTPTPDSQEEITMSKTTEPTAVEIPLPEGVKDNHTMRPTYEALLRLTSATSAEVTTESGVSVASVRRNLLALSVAGAVTSTEGTNGRIWTIAGAEPKATAPEPVEEPKQESAAKYIAEAVEVIAKTETAKPSVAQTVAQKATEAPKPVLAPTTIGGKQMTVILPHLMAHPGEFFTVKEIEEALGLPDYPRGACFRLVASNVGVEQEKRADNRLRFGYTGQAAK